MPELQRIQNQLRRALEGQTWHGPALQELLEGVSARQAAARPVKPAHTIWEMVLHITAWEKAALRMLSGEGVVELSPEEDWPATGKHTPAAWQEALQEVNGTHTALLDAVARLADKQLKQKVRSRKYSVYFLLHGLAQHAAYHGGQIALLKKALSRRPRTSSPARG